jgi:hypothetical protein
VLDAELFTRSNTVVAGDAAGVVDCSGAEVDTLRLANAQAVAAFPATGVIDLQSPSPDAGSHAEQGANRAHRIAVKPAPACRKYNYDHQKKCGQRECADCGPLRLDSVKPVNADRIGRTNNPVIGDDDQWAKDHRRESPEHAVGVEERQAEPGPSGGDACDCDPKKRLSNPGRWAGVTQ